MFKSKHPSLSAHGAIALSFKRSTHYWCQTQRNSKRIHRLPQESTELLILGNGPSLRDYEFSELSGLKTLGMNAAYRFWDRINWRPNFYCCLDDALIDTHKDAIKRLVLEHRIEQFFLTGRILVHFPEFIEYDRVRYLDEYVPHWHSVRGVNFGLNFSAHPAFNTNFPEMLTTGAYSVRFGAALGFRIIRLLGVDLTYQSIVEASASGNGMRLVMDATPTDNPNYFFSDYQQAGDQFNIANPARHGRELHLHSFIALRDDFIENMLPVRVLNSNEQSKLFSQAILPFIPDNAESLVNGDEESWTLVVATETIEQLEDIFWLWNQPAFFPLFGERRSSVVDLAIRAPTDQIKRVKNQTRNLSKRYPNVRECFRNVIVADHSIVRTNQANPDQRSSTDFFIDVNTIPFHCDWLNRIGETKDPTKLKMVLERPPENLERMNIIRSETPESALFWSPEIASRITQLRREGKSIDLARLIEMDASAPTNEGVEKRSFAKRVLAYLTFDELRK